MKLKTGTFSSAVIVAPQFGHLLRPVTIDSRRGIRNAAAVAKLPKMSPKPAATATK